MSFKTFLEMHFMLNVNAERLNVLLIFIQLVYSNILILKLFKQFGIFFAVFLISRNHAQTEVNYFQ